MGTCPARSRSWGSCLRDHLQARLCSESRQGRGPRPRSAPQGRGTCRASTRGRSRTPLPAAALPAAALPRTRQLVLLQDERKEIWERGGRAKLGRQGPAQLLLLQVERLQRPAGNEQGTAAAAAGVGDCALAPCCRCRCVLGARPPPLHPAAAAAAHWISDVFCATVPCALTAQLGHWSPLQPGGGWDSEHPTGNACARVAPCRASQHSCTKRQQQVVAPGWRLRRAAACTAAEGERPAHGSHASSRSHSQALDAPLGAARHARPEAHWHAVVGDPAADVVGGRVRIPVCDGIALGQQPRLCRQRVGGTEPWVLHPAAAAGFRDGTPAAPLPGSSA